MKIGNIVFDCTEPDRVATFWAAALGYEKGEYPPEMRQELLDGGLTEADLGDRSIAEDPSGQGPRLFFQRVPEAKSVKNRRPYRHQCHSGPSGNWPGIGGGGAATDGPGRHGDSGTRPTLGTFSRASLCDGRPRGQ